MKRGKIQSGNRCIRTCNWRSTIPRTRWEMETNSVPVKNDATSGIKLQDLQQRTTRNSRGSRKMEAIPTGHKGAL